MIRRNDFNSLGSLGITPIDDDRLRELLIEHGIVMHVERISPPLHKKESLNLFNMMTKVREGAQNLLLDIGTKLKLRG